MAKTKETPVTDDHSRRSLREKLKRSTKIVTKDGMVKKKIAKQFTSYKCDVCKKKFTNKNNLSTHKKLHLNNEYPCSECPYVGKTKKYLAQHRRSIHSVPKIKCKICGRAFHHPSRLKEHSMVHTGEKPLKCEICGKGFRVSHSLNTHMLIHKNEKPFKCSFCVYACRDSSTLRKHEHRHMGITRTYSCKICRKKFDSRPKLKYHISEVHLDYLEVNQKKYTCEHCGKTFKLKPNLTSHIELVHVSRSPCVCPLCGRRLKHESYLTAHLRRHFPERPHVCAHASCGKAFKDKGDLKKHAIIHLPHLHTPCTRCGATFSRAHRLAAHMRTHEPRQKNVTCDYCNVKFFTKNYLIKHIKQKHGEKKQQFICHHCDLVTFNKPSIVMHLKYGQCRNNRFYCKICKTTYKHISYLRSHYLKTHKMRYKPRKRQKKERKPSIEIKVEPIEDPYEEVQVSLLDVSKEEIEVDEEEEGNLENDLISYSNHVLSEDLQEYLLKEEPRQDKPEHNFDKFLLKHVFHIEIKEEEPEPKIELTDDKQVASVAQKVKDVIQKAKQDEENKLLEKKKKRQAKLLERKLKREAKIMRRKKRRERFELERVRQMYNERMKRAATEASKKEPAKKIKYFEKKTSEETNIEKEIDKNKETSHQLSIVKNHESLDNLNRNKNVISNEENLEKSNDNKLYDKIIESDINLVDELIDMSNNNDHISTDTDRQNSNRTANVENQLLNTIDDSNYDNNANTSNVINSINDKNKNIYDERHFKNNENKSLNDTHSNTNEDDSTNNTHNCTFDKYFDTNKEESGTSDKNKDTNEKLQYTIEEHNGTNDVCNNVDNSTDKERNVKDIVINNKREDPKLNVSHENDSNDDSNDKSDSASDYKPEDEPVPNKKMKFQTYQCYVCFKLYQTKKELLSHCASHFEICNSTTLSKCPACGDVVSRNMARHMRLKHDMHVTIPHCKISKRTDEQGSKYCYKMADTEVEIIPSVKMLNHSVSMEIDKRNRARRDRTVARTRLIKKGSEWIVENYAVEVSYHEMPQFTEQELGKVPVSDNDIDRLGQLGRLARRKGVQILFPCEACDKICQNFSALKLHGRRHDPDKKPFAPRRNRRNAAGAPVEDAPKIKSTENRLAKPQPIKNNHKCDEKLKKFYEAHIRGADIEFWQFLKIYNKMDRENVNDFTDLESRTDFGIHRYGDSFNPDTGESSLQNNSDIEIKKSCHEVKKSSIKTKNIKLVQPIIRTCDRKIEVSQRISSKLNQRCFKKPLKRPVSLTKKEYLQREKAKMIFREKIRGNN